MAIKSSLLNLLLFAQRWDPLSSKLSVNVLVLPKGNPLEKLGSTAIAFADASLSFEAAIVPSLAALPTLGAVSDRQPLVVLPGPPVAATRRDLFTALSKNFKIRKPKGGAAGKAGPIKKFLTPSYREATNFATPRTQVTLADRSYECALKDPTLPKLQDPPRGEFLWEEVLAFALRQPVLAQALGILYRTELTLPNNPFAAGGYLFADLAAASTYRLETQANPSLISRFAARIPPLTGDKRCFTPVLFPLAGDGNLDQVVAEADLYREGFARIVHGAQPRRAAQIEQDLGPRAPDELAPVKDVGIRLGWDDEQVTIWLNRQLGTNAFDTSQPSPGSPLGVSGYRVDARDITGADDPAALAWTSLCRVSGDLNLMGDPGDPASVISLGHFDDELTVEALPVNHTFNEAEGFWLPSYFCSWTGGSLVVADANPFHLAGVSEIVANRVYEPAGIGNIQLRYGHTYQFRVRLADLSGGGPAVEQAMKDSAPAPVATVPFLRFVPPRAVRVSPGGGVIEGTRSARFEIGRSLLGYPDIVFTDTPDALNQLLAQVVAARAGEREPALPDPDVTQLRVDVQVRTLDHDTAALPGKGEPFVQVYSAIRDFPPQPDQLLILNGQFEDVHDISTLSGIVLGAAEPLRLPSARDIRIVLTPLGKASPAQPYWGSEDSRQGAEPVSVYVRAESLDETKLLKPSTAVGEEIQAIFLQPDPPVEILQEHLEAPARLTREAPADLTSRLAGQLHLAQSGLTFSAPDGQRLVVNASSSLRHTLNPDRSSITFASKAELTRQWIVAIRLTVDRDWTWRALNPSALDVFRDGNIIGQIVLPRAINVAALQNRQPDHTDLLFLDSFDPKPAVNAFPQETVLTYQLVPSFRSAPAAPPAQEVNPTYTLRLPVTTKPAQTVKLVSAGFAFSDYVRDIPRYASSEERQRSLYFEFDGPAHDPQDKYFARVLAYAPDPMLVDASVTVPEPAEPPLEIDPELIRSITPSSTKDHAGLGRMQELTPSLDGKRYLLPLPRGMNPDAPELLGFFVYELCVGHDDTRWVTAQSRYGLPLRVAGVQHPTAQLRCSVSRNHQGVVVTAPFAAPVLEGCIVRALPPLSTLHALLYAQVMQADGSSWRNVLLQTAGAGLDGRDANDPFRRSLEGTAYFTQDDIAAALSRLGLPADAALSVVAVEMLPQPSTLNAATPLQPLTSDLGEVRILRTSSLTPVPQVCMT